MTRTIKAAACAAAAAAILGGALLGQPAAKADTVEACVIRAQETGFCVIAGRPAEPEPAEIIRTAELHTEIPRILGTLPVITGPAENAVMQTEAAPYTEEELELLACAIYQEAGGDGCSDLCRMYVGDVMLNRVDDPRFPNTLYDVLTQKHQYGLFWKTGIIWPGRASDPNEAAAVERAYDTARALLEGEHSELYGAGYIYQDTKPRGKDVIYLDGEYFGK